MNIYLPSIIFIGAFLFYAINGFTNLRRYLVMKSCCIKTYGKIIGFHKYDELQLKNMPADFNKKYHYDVEIETESGKSVCLYEETMPRLKSRRKNIGDSILLFYSDEYHYCNDYKIAKFDSWFYPLIAVIMAVFEIFLLIVINNPNVFSDAVFVCITPLSILVFVFGIATIFLS